MRTTFIAVRPTLSTWTLFETKVQPVSPTGRYSRTSELIGHPESFQELTLIWMEVEFTLSKCSAAGASGAETTQSTRLIMWGYLSKPKKWRGNVAPSCNQPIARKTSSKLWRHRLRTLCRIPWILWRHRRQPLKSISGRSANCTKMMKTRESRQHVLHHSSNYPPTVKDKYATGFYSG